MQTSLLFIQFPFSNISCRIHTALTHWVFLFLMTLVVLRDAGQVLCRMSVNWDLSFLRIIWVYEFGEGRPQTWHFNHIIQFSHSVASNSLRPHRLQHARLPCTSSSPEACSNSCPSSRWCHPSHPLLSPSLPAFSLSHHQGLFQWVSSSHQVAKILGFQSQHQSFQWIFRTDFLWDGLVGLKSKGLSRVLSNTSVQKHQLFGAQHSLFQLSIHTCLLEKQ